MALSLEGWLSKRGPTASFGWIKRWGTLSDTELKVFAEEQKMEMKSKHALGPHTRAIAFSSLNAIGDGANYRKDHPFGFTLQLDPDENLFSYFDAGDSRTLDTWIKAIAAASGRLAMAAPPSEKKLVKPSEPGANLTSREAYKKHASVEVELEALMQTNPFIVPGAEGEHHLQYWVTQCLDSLHAANVSDASRHLARIKDGLTGDKRQSAAAFKRFDSDNSGQLDVTEFGYMCAYLGFDASDLLQRMDKNRDGSVTLDEFQNMIGLFGGIQKLFSRRRLKTTTADHVQDDVAVGSRVKCYYYVNNLKSESWKEGQIIAVDVDGCPDAPGHGLLVEFGFKTNDEVSSWTARQTIPRSWILSSAEDANIVSALREIGILEEGQSFWASVFPPSELRAVANLVSCQRAALAQVRMVATAAHEAALPEVRRRFQSLGYGDSELQAVLGWVESLAPVVIQLNIDTCGPFLELDNFYRNQFETHTSNGALDDGNVTRIGWEKELFGATYDNARPVERCKYGALDVTNDYRGVTSAWCYGDSYLVLKDVRLRLTFAATDSGGISGGRLGVLDKYAHVLLEYDDSELEEVIAVATSAAIAAKSANSETLVSQLLRGSSHDPVKEWVTKGFPKFKQRRGNFYFEAELFRGCRSPQVGVLSSSFECQPGVASTIGVGDDEAGYGWSVDGQHSALLHGGISRAWATCWPSNDEDNSLLEKQVVGVFVDIDQRSIWFSTDGSWKEEPSFGSDAVPDTVSLYPAASFQGKAAFNFGPDFEYTLPTTGCFAGKSFRRWPGAPKGRVRLDAPTLGNSDILKIYKEIQIHGQVDLGKHVQRLVANPKYLDRAKPERSWKLVVSNAGTLNGAYARVGAHDDMPLFKRVGEPAIIYFDVASQSWRINDKEDFKAFQFAAPLTSKAMNSPPVDGWVGLPECYGVVSHDIFKAVLARAGVDDNNAAALLRALGKKSTDGQEVIYRRPVGTTLENEWAKLPSPPSKTHDEVWQAAIDERLQQLLVENGFGKTCVVLSTDHPYPRTSHSWTKDVQISGAKNLTVLFSKMCSTSDQDEARLNVYEGSHAIATGAAVVVTSLCGSTYDATITDRGSAAGLWQAKLEREIVLQNDMYKALVGSAECFAVCSDNPTPITVTYSNTTVGDEVEFQINTTYPLTPVSVVLKGQGPAQQAGVASQWFLDVESTISMLSNENLLLLGRSTGEKFPPFFVVWENAAKQLDGLVFADITEATNVFSECTEANKILLGADYQELDCKASVHCKDRLCTWARNQRLVALRPQRYDENVSEFLTSGVPSLGKSSGKYYYEVLLGDNLELTQIGWVTHNFSFSDSYSSEGVGDDSESWAVDGIRDLKWHGGETESIEWPSEWTEGDVVGCAIDIDEGSMSFSLNGTFQDSASFSFQADGRSFYPALSVTGDFIFLMSASAFKFKPPAEAFVPLVDAESLCGSFRRADSQHISDSTNQLIASHYTMEEMYRDVSKMKTRLDALRQLSNVTLIFTNSLQARIWPIRAVIYSENQKVCDEIASFYDCGGKPCISGFVDCCDDDSECENGAACTEARSQGVREGWVLNISKTLSVNAKLTRDDIFFEGTTSGDCFERLMLLSDVTLFFQPQSYGEPVISFGDMDVENGCRFDIPYQIPGDSAKFTWSCQGCGDDSSGEVEERWGIFGVVTDGVNLPAREQLEELAYSWAKVKAQSSGCKEPRVQAAGWDAERLRALCKRHGWEFEWMTEECERKRRIDLPILTKPSVAKNITAKKGSCADLPDSHKKLN